MSNALLQSMVVTVLVTLCGIYAVWTLMPAGLRRALATALLRLPLPEALAARLRLATQAASGCGGGCSSCSSRSSRSSRDTASPKRASGAVQTITFHSRTQR